MRVSNGLVGLVTALSLACGTPEKPAQDNNRFDVNNANILYERVMGQKEDLEKITGERFVSPTSGLIDTLWSDRTAEKYPDLDYGLNSDPNPKRILEEMEVINDLGDYIVRNLGLNYPTQPDSAAADSTFTIFDKRTLPESIGYGALFNSPRTLTTLTEFSAYHSDMVEATRPLLERVPSDIAEFWNAIQDYSQSMTDLVLNTAKGSAEPYHLNRFLGAVETLKYQSSKNLDLLEGRDYELILGTMSEAVQDFYHDPESHRIFANAAREAVSLPDAMQSTGVLDFYKASLNNLSASVNK